ncbi:nuclear transport factor 2 family protein [Sphingomonas profundi]|uniref:nuclear transport factor 2 family protein n=1 Tax=Alterirhizorhabdus profundi TaxID=2681549 RepID=UPI0012E7439F|nr:nuclear transport factor 2 family protein [Sphingomonas profundi]
MPFSGPAEDRLAIHELVASYGDAVTCRDGDAWIANWAEDAVWKLPAIPGMERVEGRDAILAAWVAAMPGWPKQINFQRCGAIAVDGDRASGHTYTDELNTDTEGKVERWLNRYDDEWVKRDGRWMFASRSLTVLHIGPG